MTKSQLKCLEACQGCSDLHRCKVHWGKKCNRQGGKKVPRLRLSTYNDIVRA